MGRCYGPLLWAGLLWAGLLRVMGGEGVRTEGVDAVNVPGRDPVDRRALLLVSKYHRLARDITCLPLLVSFVWAFHTYTFHFGDLCFSIYITFNGDHKTFTIGRNFT